MNDCDDCNGARLIGFEGCGPLDAHILKAFDDAHSALIEDLVERLKKAQEETKKTDEEMQELAAFIRVSIAEASLGFAARLSHLLGEDLGSFVGDAAEIWQNIKEEPARQVISSFIEHVNSTVIKKVAEGHSPNN